MRLKQKSLYTRLEQQLGPGGWILRQPVVSAEGVWQQVCEFHCFVWRRNQTFFPGRQRWAWTSRTTRYWPQKTRSEGETGENRGSVTWALYFSGHFIMTWVSLSKWNELVNGLRHFLWLCTSDSYQDLGKEQQDIWIWYIFLCLWGPVVLFQISAVQRGGREREIVRKRQVEGGGEVGLIYEFRVSHF